MEKSNLLLKINKVHLLAVSAGGPSGLCFSANYPDKVNTLTLQSAVTKEWLTPQDKEYKAARVLFHPNIEKYTWRLIAFMSNHFPRMIVKQMAPSFSTLPYRQIVKAMKEEDMEEMRKMNNRQRSYEGFFIDLAQTKEISTEELQLISCPTLVMHSKNDRSVPMEHVEHAMKHIPTAKECLLDTWGHLIWLGKTGEETNHGILEFLKTHPSLSKEVYW